MPRQVDSSRTRRVGAQKAQDVGRLSVVAPSGSSVAVRSGSADTAEALQTALGLGGQAAAMYENHQASSAQTAVSRGEVTRDNIDELDEGGRFLFHANKTLRTREASDFASALAQKYIEEFPKDGTDVELNDWWTENVMETYKGIDDEDVAVMAPILDRQRDALVQQHTNQQIENTTAQLEQAAALNTTDMFLDPESDYTTHRADLVEQFGTHGANAVLAQGAIDAMAQTGDATIVDRLPKELRTNPKFAGAIQKAQVAAQEASTAQARLVGRAEVDTLVRRGQLTVEQASTAYNAGIYASPEAAGSALADSLANAEKGLNIESSAAAFLSGDGYLVEGKHRQDGLKEAAVQHAKAHGLEPEESAFRLGLANGVMLREHEDKLKLASLANGEGFQEAYGLYQQYNAADPKFTSGVVPDAQQTLFDGYRQMTEVMGMDPKAAVERLKNSDMQIGRATIATREVGDLLASAYDDLRDIPWSLRELQDTPVLRNELRSLATTYAAMGTFTAEQSMGLALDHLSKNRVEIDGYAFHRNQGWPTENLEGFVDNVKSRYLPEGEDPDDWRISPDFGTKVTNDVVLVREGDLPFGEGHITFNIRDEGRMWEAEQRGIAAAEASKANAQMRAANRLQAKKNIGGFRPAGVESNYEPTEAEIEAELVEMEAGRKARQEARDNRGATANADAAANRAWVAEQFGKIFNSGATSGSATTSGSGFTSVPSQ